MTDTTTSPARATTTRWERHSPLQTFAELLLGLSFTAAVAFGGYGVVTGQLTVLSQVAGIVFLVTLTCVLVSWFRAVEREDTPAPTGRAVAQAASAAVAQAAPASVNPIAAVDAEYRR
ncbi:hypothetical protein DEJ28_03430 [Curtobacterium sp. MCPF17_002]|uniref:hypothetical protein n=1 Tax=Curtobacterium sp. MCPF17_002 TaxID=2175645 RepID=UPI000DA7DCF2|nr:hypothetical protein [Curtobacterium sp. MCPF17_002]WIB78168.1 hypothetical protein DEJ28_03430 [Curtobacterium sp. MCPF17_002]